VLGVKVGSNQGLFCTWRKRWFCKKTMFTICPIINASWSFKVHPSNTITC